MEWFLVIGYTLVISGVTGILVLLHKRVSFLEDRLIRLAEAYLNLSKALKIMSELQNETTNLIRKSIEAHNESTTT